MRHRKRGKKLGRKYSEKKALFRSLARALFTHYEIVTTLQKAKGVQGFVERLIAFAKTNSLSARREVLKKLPDKHAVSKLFHEIAPVYAQINGGFTRIIRLGTRKGDGALEVLLQLTHFEDKIKEKVEQRERKREERKKKEEERI